MQGVSSNFRFLAGQDQRLYRLATMADDIRQFGMVGKHATIYLAKVRAFHVTLPPVEEQRETVERIKPALACAARLKAEATRARALFGSLEAAILAKAFRGDLAPQDPNDEPASVLLDRTRAKRVAAPNMRRTPHQRD